MQTDPGAEADLAVIDIDRFLKILRVELVSLCENLELRVRQYRERDQRHEITEHVYLENVAVLQNEECGCQHFLHILDAVRPAAGGSVAAVAAHLRDKYREVIRHSGLAQAALILAEEKIAQVERYVRGPDR